MPPVVLIIEPRSEVASALESAIAMWNLSPVVVQHLERLGDVPHSVAVIVVRVAFEGLGEPAHVAVERLPRERPPVVAIASTLDEVAEARRLKCDVVPQAPQDVNRLCENADEPGAGLALSPCPLPLQAVGEMLLLPGSLLAELTHHFLPKPRSFGEHIVQPIEYLFESFSADRGPVGHSCRKDYVNKAKP